MGEKRQEQGRRATKAFGVDELIGITKRAAIAPPAVICLGKALLVSAHIRVFCLPPWKGVGF
jgi:hypothetical protein